MTVMVYVALILAGLIFGSFINALVWRLHQQRTLASQKRPDKKRAAALSMTKGRSMCSKCEHPLAPKDLVPLFSWITLGGRCRYCRQPIADSPIIEALLPFLFVASYYFWPYGTPGWSFGVWLVALVILAALAVYDLKWFLLPDKLVFPLVAISGVYAATRALEQTDADSLISSVIGGLLISGIFYGLYRFNQNWIGFGDVKLAIALGLLAGTPLQASLILFGASVIGTLLNLPALAKGKAGLQKQVPFGPLLVAGTYLVVLFGPPLTRFLLLV